MITFIALKKIKYYKSSHSFNTELNRVVEGSTVSPCLNVVLPYSTDFLHVMLVQRAECYRLSVATCAVTHQATNRTVNGRSHLVTTSKQGKLLM